MERQDLGDVFFVDEAVDFAIAVAGDVGKDGAMAGFFVEPVNGHDGENLVDGPRVGQRLEEAEVAVVEIDEGGRQLTEIFRDVVEFGDEVGNAGDDVPEPGLGQAAFAQGGGTVEELRAHLVAVVDGVVKALLKVVFANDLVDLDDVHEVLRRVFGNGGGSVAILGAGDVENVEDEHRIVGDHRAARLGNEIGVSHPGFVTNLGDDFDDVGAIFRDRVVARGVEVRVRAVVIDRHAATDVEHAHRCAFLDEVAIHADGLGRAFADGRDVGDLRTLVVVQHLQAADVTRCLEVIDDCDDLGCIEAEDRFVARAILPMAGALGGKADADAEIGQHADFTRAFED